MVKEYFLLAVYQSFGYLQPKIHCSTFYITKYSRIFRSKSIFLINYCSCILFLCDIGKLLEPFVLESLASYIYILQRFTSINHRYNKFYVFLIIFPRNVFEKRLSLIIISCKHMQVSGHPSNKQCLNAEYTTGKTDTAF